MSAGCFLRSTRGNVPDARPMVVPGSGWLSGPARGNRYVVLSITPVWQDPVTVMV